MSSWGYVDQRDASLNSFATFDEDLAWDGFEGTCEDGVVPDRGGGTPLEIRKGKRSSRNRPSRYPPSEQLSKLPTSGLKLDVQTSTLSEAWDAVGPPSSHAPQDNSSILDGFGGSGVGNETGRGGSKEMDMSSVRGDMDMGSFSLHNLGSGDMGGIGSGKRMSVDYGYEGLGDMDVWFKGPDTSTVPWEQPTPSPSATATLPKQVYKTENYKTEEYKTEDDEGLELQTRLMNEDTPSPPLRSYDSGKDGQSDESQSNSLFPFQDEDCDWASTTGDVGLDPRGETHPPREQLPAAQFSEGGADVKRALGGNFESSGGWSSDFKEKMQVQLNREKEMMNRQIQQQLTRQQKERDDQQRTQQAAGEQLFRKQEQERHLLYMQVQKQQQQQRSLGPMVGTSQMPLAPPPRKEDLEKIALELAAAEPRPLPEAQLTADAPSNSSSEIPQDDASIKRARRQAVARRLEQTGKRVPKSPSFSNLSSSKGSFSPSRKRSNLHTLPPPSSAILPGGSVQRSPPLSPAPPKAALMRPPPLVLPQEQQQRLRPPLTVPAGPPSQMPGIVPTPSHIGGPPQGGFHAPGYIAANYPGRPPFRPPMFYPQQQMGPPQGAYLAPPGAGQIAWRGAAIVPGDPGLAVPADDDSAEANVFRELEGAMRTLDVGMRLTLRDSLFRLADSASHRAANDVAPGVSGNSTATPLQTGSSAPGTSEDKEKVTQIIDRAVANLLYHKQLTPKLEELPPPSNQHQFLTGPQPNHPGGHPHMGQMPPPGGQPMMMAPLGGMMGPREWYWHDTGQGGSQMVSTAQLALPPQMTSAGSANPAQSTGRYKRGRAGAKLEKPATSAGRGAPLAPAGKGKGHVGGFGVPKPKLKPKEKDAQPELTLSNSFSSTSNSRGFPGMDGKAMVSEGLLRGTRGFAAGAKPAEGSGLCGPDAAPRAAANIARAPAGGAAACNDVRQSGGVWVGVGVGGKGQKHKAGGDVENGQGSAKVARNSEAGRSGVSSTAGSREFGRAGVDGVHEPGSFGRTGGAGFAEPGHFGMTGGRRSYESSTLGKAGGLGMHQPSPFGRTNTGGLPERSALGKTGVNSDGVRADGGL